VTAINRTSGFVALMTFVDEPAGMFYEEGGVYPKKPACKFATGARQLESGEHVASCPRCGHLFAATDGTTAEENRDFHFDGDEASPSICADLWSPEVRNVAARVRGKEDYAGLAEVRNRQIQEGVALKAALKSTGRNDPCLCGSGIKFKRCCLSRMQEHARGNPAPRSHTRSIDVSTKRSLPSPT
jgi:hypothetical protein